MQKITILLCALLLTQTLMAALPELNQSLEQASVRSAANQLTVSTGAVTRTWLWTGKGLVTTAVEDCQSGQNWIQATEGIADWDLGDQGEGKLVYLNAQEDDDEHFTTKHLSVTAEIHYPRLHVQYIIWAYPGAPGIRTQLWLRKPRGSQWEPQLGSGISECLTLARTPQKVSVFGYCAGLKAHMIPYEILQEETLAPNAAADWASGLLIAEAQGGLFLVKESHLHTHMHFGELATGDIRRLGNLVQISGLGLRPEDLQSDRYRFCWANWMILYRGDHADAQLALKQFDRARYPVHPDRDIFIMANTWGTEDKQPQCKYKAREENVLRELEVCAELGIDILQIDDGWQDKNWRPRAEAQDTFELHNGEKFNGTYPLYPQGFGKVRARAQELGMKLGLWHAWRAPIESIKANYDEGDFKGFKLDFANLKKKDSLDYLYYKARDLVKYSNYSAVVNWDVTEMAPRMGYYFGRDCGNLYLANRKAFTIRKSVQYDPWQVLRDAWELAYYTNLNKIQVTYQNKDITPPQAVTDALKYTHGYNMAITLMASPIFFTETQFIPPAARLELREIIAAYKHEREAMYRGYVFAIGNKPDNGNWTGFQNIDPDTGHGYLTVFRELNNPQSQAELSLHFYAAGTQLQLTDLLSGQQRTVTLDEEKRINFTIPEAPGFRFLKVTKK